MRLARTLLAAVFLHFADANSLLTSTPGADVHWAELAALPLYKVRTAHLCRAPVQPACFVCRSGQAWVHGCRTEGRGATVPDAARCFTRELRLGGQALAGAGAQGWLTKGRLAARALQPMVLLIQAVGLQLPLRTHTALQGLGLASYLYSSRGQCARECAHEHLRAHYEAAAGRGRVWLGRLLPVVVPSRRDARFEGEAACLLVHAWAMWVVGYLLPTLVLDWALWRSRRTHLRFRPHGPRSAAAYAGLLAGGTILGCYACTLAPKLYPVLSTILPAVMGAPV